MSSPVAEAVAKHATPLWSVAPFVGYLLLIATLPLFLGALLGEQPQQAPSWPLVAAAPVVAYLVGMRSRGAEMLFETALDYVSFMALLGFAVRNLGRHLPSRRAGGNAALNTALMAMGALLANRRHDWRRGAVDSTAAARQRGAPPPRAPGGVLHLHRRQLRGLLTPLGDPPLFLGFLRGVPFTWTLRLLRVGAGERGAAAALRGLSTGGHPSWTRAGPAARPDASAGTVSRCGSSGASTLGCSESWRWCSRSGRRRAPVPNPARVPWPPAWGCGLRGRCPCSTKPAIRAANRFSSARSSRSRPSSSASS